MDSLVDSGSSEDKKVRAGDQAMPRVAGYQLVEQIGEGGMGVVYKAEQSEPVRRVVALKVIRKGMDTREVLARFDAERQALAMMDHPGIAKVYDAGETETGSPYFVMDYVNGIPLNEYCEHQQLTKAARLDLFIEVCKAVQHAHQKGIIHRDLKPSNILVSIEEGVPAPRIIDFGIAKAASGGEQLTDRTLFTGFLQIVGTPAYMSPEQAEISGMDIDTRTDIYALGVILYELLTGTLPFDAKRFEQTALAEIERILWEEEPPSPSKRLASLAENELTTISTTRGTTPRRLLSEVIGELDWIVMKAMEKDRKRRYESATALADDLRRHLNHEPVAASPPSRFYLVSKFVRRHRVGIGMAAVLTLTLISATVVSAWQAKRASDSQLDAEVARDEAERERLAADTARGVAERESEAAKQTLRINDKMLQFLMIDMLEIGNPLKEPDRDIKLRTVVDRAAKRLEDAFEQERDIRFAMSMTMGRMYSSLGELDEARRLLEMAITLGDELWGDEETELTAGVKNALGTVALNQGKYEEAEKLFEVALREHIRLFGENRSQAIFSRLSLGVTYQQLRRYAEARATLEAAIPPSERVLGPNHVQTVTLFTKLGEVCKSAGQEEDANRYFTIAQERYKNYQVDTEFSPVTVDAMSNQGVVLMNQGKFKEALPIMEKVVELSKKIQGPDNPQTLISIHNLAAVHLQMRRPDLAHPLFKEVLESEVKALGETHPNSLDSLKNYAMNCFRVASDEEIDRGVVALKRMVHLHHELSGENAAPLEFAYVGLQKWLPKLGRDSELVELRNKLTGDVTWPEQRVETLVKRGAEWRYDDGPTPSSDFTKADFDDGEWKTGAAPLGYNDDHLATEIGFGSDEKNKHKTACFRHEFQVEDTAAFEKLKIRLRYDDLAEISLNGKKVASGEEGRNSDRLAEKLYYTHLIDADQLVNGRNVLAVAVSQAEPTSSDLIFDLALEGLTREEDDVE